MHDISPYNLDRTISISGELKEIADAEQLITEKLRQYEVCSFSLFTPFDANQKHPFFEYKNFLDNARKEDVSKWQ